MLYPGSIEIHHGEVGIETVGDLTLLTDWRPPHALAPDRNPQYRWQEDLILPLAGVMVVPDHVIYRDNGSAPGHRPNSAKCFAYMMGNRAHPSGVLGGEGVDNLLSCVDTPKLAGYVGYGAIRQGLVAVIRDFVAGRIEEGHYTRSNLHVLFRYQPPKDKTALNSLHKFIRSKAS